MAEYQEQTINKTIKQDSLDRDIKMIIHFNRLLFDSDITFKVIIRLINKKIKTCVDVEGCYNFSDYYKEIVDILKRAKYAKR